MASEPQFLKLSRIEYDEGQIPSVPRAAVVSGGHLIVATYGDIVFRIFELPVKSGDFTSVRQGRGPGEIQGLDYKSLAPSGDDFWFVDAQGARLARITNGDIRFSEPEAKFSASVAKNGIIKIRNGYVDMNTGTDNHEYILYNLKFPPICSYD